MSVSITRLTKWAALAAIAGAGLMQAAEQATFHLPVAAHWGLSVLQPGDYRMSLPQPSLNERTLLVAGTGQTTRPLPLVTDTRERSKTSYLELWQIDGQYFVHELSVGPSGKSFTFVVPKSGHRTQVARIATNTPSETE